MNEDLRRTTLAPSPPRALHEALAQRVREWASNEVPRLLVEPILHPSAWRIRTRGVSTLAGHPLDAEFLQDRIFEPFVSTDRGAGHGLGLAFWQRVVPGAQGTMGVASAPHRTRSPRSSFRSRSKIHTARTHRP